MSQITVNVPGGGPAIPTTFTAEDLTTANPVANNLNLFTGDGLTSTAATDTVTFSIDGLVEGTGTTVNAATADLITVSAGAVAGVYQVEAHCVGFDSATPAGCGYQIINGVRTTGAAAVLTGGTDSIVNEEAAVVTAQADIIVSGNTFIVRVTGVNLLTLTWNCRLKWIFVS